MKSSALALIALLAATPLLAGCVDTAGVDLDAGSTLAPSTRGLVHGVDGKTLGALDGALAGLGALGVQLSIGADATEPTVGVTPDGTLFMTGFHKDSGVAVGGPTVYRSTDDGASWEDVGPTFPTGDGNPPITNDPMVHVDPDTGRVFMLDLYALVCSWLSYSDDDGDSWTTQPAACGQPVGVHDHQTIGTAAPRALPTVGYDNLVYYCVNRVVDSACATSLTGGLTWGPLVTVYEGMDSEGGLCGGLSGHLSSDAEGRVFLPRDYCGKVSVAVTEDDGLTWTVQTIAEEQSQGHEVRVASDDALNLYAFWISQESGLPRLSVSRDHGASWSEPVTVSAPGVTATEFPAIAAGAEGRIAFAYVGSTIEDGYEGKDTGIGGLEGDLLGEPRPSEWENATWNAYVGVITNALTDEPTIVTVTANDPEDPIARGLCGRTRCGGMNDFIDIDIGPDGRPWAAFVDVCTAECVTDKSVWYDEPIGFAGTLAEGPALRGPSGALPALGSGESGAGDGGHEDAAAAAPATLVERVRGALGR